MAKKKNELSSPKFSADLKIGSLCAIEDEDRIDNLIVSDSVLDGSTGRHACIEAVKFQKVSFRYSDLANLKLLDVRFENCDLSNSSWSQCTMNRVEFECCRMTGMRMPKAKWTNVLLRNSKCDLLHLAASQLSLVHFERCSLTQADLRQTELNEMAFRESTLSDSEFFECKFNNTDFRSSKIDGINLRPEDWKGSIIDSVQLISLASELAKAWGIKIDDSPLQSPNRE